MNCRWCTGEIDPFDELGMDTGYCSSDCYEQSAFEHDDDMDDDDDELDW